MAKDDALLTEIRDRFRLATDYWREVRDEAATDMRYVAGDPWDPKERRAREDAGRVCLALDELGQYINQVVNDVRANPRAVKFSPTGNGANDKAAEFYQHKTREIEYRSHAQIAYTTAFENAVSRSYGWVRLKTDYPGPRSMEQDIWIEDVPNPDMVLVDPESKRPDASDARWLFHFEHWTQDEFTRRFPKADIHNFSDYQVVAPQWVQDRSVVVAEYWCVKTTPRELLLVADEQGQARAVFEDEGPVGQVLARRSVDYPQVRSYLTNGIEVLEQTEWPGRYIPFVSCVGKVLYVDEGSGTKRKIMSMTRLARDPFMLYCYYRTCEAELVGMTPKFPYFVYEDQLSPEELVNLQKSLHQPIAVIRVKPTVTGAPGQILAFPQRQPYEPPIQALEVGAEAARRAIQAAMGSSPLPTSAQRRNEKSGIALQQIEETSQRGTFHFIDHYEDMIRQVGVVIEDLMDKIYDTPRDVGVRKPNDTAQIVRINDPNDPESVSTAGDYLVTISTGPSFESEREAASDFADTLAQNPQIFSLIGPLVVKLKNLGPIGDEIAKALEVLQPPELRKQEDGSDPLPPEVQQQLQQLGQMVEMLTKELDAKTKAIETDEVKARQDLERAKLEIDAKLTIEREKLALEMRKLEVTAEIEAAKLGSAESMKRLLMEQQALHAHSQQELAEQKLGVDVAKQSMADQSARDEAEASRSFQSEESARAREAEREESSGVA